MPLSPQQRRFLYTHNHPSVQSVKQQEAAAYVARLNQRLQALQQQQVKKENQQWKKYTACFESIRIKSKNK